MIYERTELLKSFDGTDLFFRCFTPKKRDRRARTEGLILAVHDFGEHSGRFQELAEWACARNLAVASFDLRGHGKSGPRRGDAENLHALVLDVVYMIQHSREFFGIKPPEEHFFGVLGHGFGALVATYAAAVLAHSCPPLFLTSPLFRLRQKAPLWRKVLTSSIPQLVPVVQLPLLKPGQTSLPAVPEAEPSEGNESLALRTVSLRLEDILNQALDDTRVRQAITLVRSPVTVACAAADKVIDVEHVKGIFPLFASHETALHLLPGSAHDPWSQPAERREELQSLLAQWVENKGFCS